MQFQADEHFALRLDTEDPLGRFREQFHLPLGKDGTPLVYFAGNSLGLMPKAARRIVEEELDNWAQFGVEAHHAAGTPWYTYHQSLRQPLARIVGAQPNEVVAMNSLTINLHLMMATFYRPTKSRFRVLTEAPAFPSDSYAIQSQIAHHGFLPNESIVRPASDDRPNGTAALVNLIEEHQHTLALVLIGAVNFFTGELFDIAAIAAAARKHGIPVGIDLAHAIGNVPLALHDSGVDFAVWCSYKYLNAGPGAIAGAFVHERHATNTELPRLAGWFGNDPNTRFRLHLNSEFVPVASADAWQVSNPPILAMAPLRASLAIFDDAGGMQPLRQKSLRLTGYLEYLLDRIGSTHVSVVTPRSPDARGAQLSIAARHDSKQFFQKLQANGVICDFREPNVIRVAPAPLYNSFHDVWRFAAILREAA